MKLFPAFLPALLGACVLLAGCATPPKFGAVNVTLVGFRPSDDPTVTGRAIMTLRFTSEGVNAAAFTHSTHSLSLNGAHLGKAVNPNPFGLPPEGTMTLDMTVVLDDPGVVRRVLAVSDQARYSLDSVLYYTDGEHTAWLKSHAEGSTPIAGLEAAAR